MTKTTKTAIITATLLIGISLVVTCIILAISNYECPHRNVETTLEVKATCTRDGYTEGRVCLTCGEVLSERVKIPGRHKFDEGTVKKKNTCTRDGKTVYTCSECGFVDERTVAAAHNFEYDICTVCGEINESSGGSGWERSSVNSNIWCKNCIIDSYETNNSYTGAAAILNGAYIYYYRVCRGCDSLLSTSVRFGLINKLDDPWVEDFSCPYCNVTTIVKIKVSE